MYGFESQNIIDKIINTGPHVMLIKLNNNNVIGSYNNRGYKNLSNSGYLCNMPTDKQAFIFSLQNNKLFPQ